MECHRTKKNGMYTGTWCLTILCARTSLDLDSGTGTVVRPVPGVQIVERGATSGSVRKRGKNKKEERERERGGNRVPLFSPPISPHRFFFFLLLTSLCTVPTT